MPTGAGGICQAFCVSTQDWPEFLLERVGLFKKKKKKFGGESSTHTHTHLILMSGTPLEARIELARYGNVLLLIF